MMFDDVTIKSGHSFIVTVVKDYYSFMKKNVFDLFEGDRFLVLM